MSLKVLYLDFAEVYLRQAMRLWCNISSPSISIESALCRNQIFVIRGLSCGCAC